MFKSKTKIKLAGGEAHEMPADLEEALLASPEARKLWEETITPLGRNEWICWVVSPKRIETRNEHVPRVVEEIIDGMRRPCCWAGCIHRQKTKK